VASGETPELEGFSATQRQVVLELLQSSAQLAPSALAQKIMAILGFEPSLELTQFVNALVRFETIEAALKHLDVIAEQDFYDPQADAITLLTIHAAKGLEFPHVFVVGVEDGILPSKRAPVEEERRLFYVAATRAQERLDLLHAKHRGGQPATPSPFITNLTAEVLERLTDPDMQAQVKRIAKRAAKRSQQSLF
jgi:superfamily I DNA/RNA helicase